MTINFPDSGDLMPSGLPAYAKPVRILPAFAVAAPNRALICFISTLLGVCSLSISTFGQEKDPQPAHYRSFLWIDEDFQVNPELLEILKQLGLSGTNVAGTASAELQAKRGIPFYVDHLAGKGFLYLKDEVWSEIEAQWQEDRALGPIARSPSLRSAAAMKKAEERIDEILDQNLKAGPVALSLDDEISLGRRNWPIDLGFEEEMQAPFRSYLKRRYRNAEELKESWELNELTPIDSILPTSTAEIRRSQFLRESSQQNFAPWNDYRDFLDEELARVVRELANFARQRVGSIPVGFTGGEAPHPFSGVDWSRLLEVIDFCEPYDIGGSRELVRSFASPETLVMHTLFEDARHPRANEQELWDYFLRGDRGVIIWAASKFLDDPKKLSPTKWALRMSPVLQEIGSPNLRAFSAARPEPARIAILESQASNRAHWMLDSRGDGRAWIRRLASYEVENSSQNIARESWQKLLEDLHLEYQHIAARSLDRRKLAQFDVLVLPRIIALSDHEARLIREFANRGTVIADCQTGLFHENLKPRKSGALDDLFGIERDNRLVYLREAAIEPSREDGPKGLSCAEPGIKTKRGVGATLRFADVPAMVIQQHGSRGRSVYLNLLVHDYLKTRLHNQESNLLSELRGVFRIAGARPEAELREITTRPPQLRIFRRFDDRYEYLALLWNWRQSAFPLSADELAQLQSTTFELLLPRATRLEFLVGQDADEDAERERPKRRSSVNIKLSPFRPTILRLDRERNDVRDR